MLFRSPANYIGILPWKLEIEQMSNRRARVSQIAYTKSQKEVTKKEKIQVLQVTPSGTVNTMDLTTGTIRSMLNELAEYDIIVTKVDARYVSGKLAEQIYNGTEYVNGYAFYDMLVIGFDDSFLNANSTETKAAIIKFTNTGKSVLMSHDFVCFFNVDVSDNKSRVVGHNKDGLYKVKDDNYKAKTVADKNLNDDFRNLMGLDRFGVTTQEQSAFLKQGELLNYNSSEGKWYTEWQTNTPAKDPEHRKPGMLNKPEILNHQLLGDRDIAYVPHTNKMQAYAEVEGYCNAQISRSMDNTNALKNTNVAGAEMLANQADQINDGVITRYPYEIGKEIRVVDTHAQYYQLDMDTDKDKDGSPDIVVWYTIAPGYDKKNKNKYRDTSNVRGSEGDVRNNYYIYSIGNIMYTGFGHSYYDATLDKGQELKLFINTFVAAYKLQIQEFEITPLESANATAAEVDSHLLNSDGMTRLDNSVHFDFLAQDPNLVSNKKTVRTTYSLRNMQNNLITLPSGLTFTTINAETGEILASIDNGSVVTGMQSGLVYTVTLNNISGIPGDFKVLTTIETTYDYYGDKIIKKASRDVSFRTAMLFELN